MLWVCRSSVKRFRKPHSSKLSRVHLRRRNPEVRMLRLAAARMVLGPGKEISPISATSCIRKPISHYCLIANIRLHSKGARQPGWPSVECEFVFRNREYFGVKANCIDFAIKRKTAKKSLGDLDKERNRVINISKSLRERPHEVIIVFNATF